MSTAAQPTMLLTHKYRLNPILEQQRQLYNAALEERILAWAKGRSITEYDQSRSLTQIRADDPSFAGVQRRIQRGTLKRLDLAYKAFFRRAKAGAVLIAGMFLFHRSATVNEFLRLGRWGLIAGGLSRIHDPSLSQRRDRFGCFCGTLSPSRRRSPWSSDRLQTKARR